jgi:hypothetical protein
VQILHRFVGSIQRDSQEIFGPDRYRPDHCPQCAANRHAPPTQIERSQTARSGS